jgi:hypothetical protein
LALQGTLDTFALPDVLRLLAATAKTGCLQIEGDRGRGVVWVSEGRVLAASADRAQEAPLDEVMFELLRYETGSFRFAVDATAASVEGDGDDIEATLLRAMGLLDEWHALEPVVPSMSHGVSLVGELPRDHVTIDAGTWRVLATVASGRAVGDLAHDLGIGELEVSRLVYGMVQLGVVTVDPPPTAGLSSLPGVGALNGLGVGAAGAPSGNVTAIGAASGSVPAVRTPTGGVPPVGDVDPASSLPSGLSAWNEAIGDPVTNGDRAARRRSTRGTR